jgi:hypothetical protein
MYHIQMGYYPLAVIILSIGVCDKLLQCHITDGSLPFCDETSLQAGQDTVCDVIKYEFLSIFGYLPICHYSHHRRVM